MTDAVGPFQILSTTLNIKCLLAYTGYLSAGIFAERGLLQLYLYCVSNSSSGTRAVNAAVAGSRWPVKGRSSCSCPGSCCPALPSSCPAPPSWTAPPSGSSPCASAGWCLWGCPGSASPRSRSWASPRSGGTQWGRTDSEQVRRTHCKAFSIRGHLTWKTMTKARRAAKMAQNSLDRSYGVLEL